MRQLVGHPPWLCVRVTLSLPVYQMTASKWLSTPSGSGALRPMRVDVVDVVADVVGLQRVLVVREVVRRRRRRVVGQLRRTAVVLGGEDQDPRVLVGLQLVGERAAALVARLEPHLHGVAGVGPVDLAAHAVVPVVAGAAVALAAAPLPRPAGALATVVDAVLDRHATEVAAGVDLDGLRAAVGDVERADLEVRRLTALPRLGVARVVRRARHVERELHVPLELGLDVGLDVLEHEPAAGRGGRALGRERDRLVRVVHVVVQVTVGGVEVRPHARVRVRDRRVRLLGAGDRAEDRLVRLVGVELPAGRPQQQRAVGVVVLVPGEADPPHEAVERLGLGLGGRAGAAVCLRRRDRARALVVVAPVRRVVAVRVDAVDVVDLAVAVVVAQVLAPQAVGRREGVVVAVGVGDHHEPQLAGVDELGDLLGLEAEHGLAVGAERRALLAVVVQEQAHGAAAGLGGEPLARVLGGRVEDRRPRAVTAVAGVLGHLHRVDRHTADGLADDLQLGDVAVLGRELLELGDDVVGRVAGVRRELDVGAQVRAPDLPAGGGSLGRRLQDRAAAPVARETQLDPLGTELLRLRGRGHDLDAVTAASLGDVHSASSEQLEVGGAAQLDGVRLLPLRRGGRTGRQQDRERRRARDPQSA